MIVVDRRLHVLNRVRRADRKGTSSRLTADDVKVVRAILEQDDERRREAERARKRDGPR